MVRSILFRRLLLLSNHHSVALHTADSDYPHDAASVETKTAPVQSVVMMECRTDLRAPVKFTWSRQGGILPKAARIEGVS